MPTTVEQRAKAMLGEREVRVRPGFLGQIEVESSHEKGAPDWYVLNLRTRECTCWAFIRSTASPKICKHLTMADTLLEAARVFKAAGVAL